MTEPLHVPATVLTTLMSVIVSVANSMTEDQQLAKLISNVRTFHVFFASIA